MKDLNNKINISEEFKGLFDFQDENQIIEHESQMLSFRFIDKIEREMERKKVNKKTLAEGIGTSASYITQLFRGDKLLNLEVLTKIRIALDFEWEITIKQLDHLCDYDQVSDYKSFNYKTNNNFDGFIKVLKLHQATDFIESNLIEDRQEKPLVA